jgi:hypothetical protein
VIVGDLIKKLQDVDPNTPVAGVAGSDYCEATEVTYVDLVERGGWLSLPTPLPHQPNPDEIWFKKHPEFFPQAEENYRFNLQRHHDDEAKKKTHLFIG